MPEESSYLTHAARLQQRAKAEHATWIAGLTKDQRANLERLGVLDFPDDSTEVGGHAPGQTADAAESSLARTEVDFAAAIDSQAEILADQFDLPLATARAILQWHVSAIDAAMRTQEADLLSIVVGGLLASKNVRIAAGGLAFAAGMAATSGIGTQADFARQLGVSRTIISKSMLAWKRQLKLRTNAGQKSDEACQIYRAVATERHWRKQKVSASALSERLARIRKKQS